MRRSERVLVYGGVALAVALGLMAREPGTTAHAAWVSGATADMRVAAVDVYLVAEAAMKRPEPVAEREAVNQKWRTTLEAIEAELQTIDTTLRMLAPGSQQAPELMSRGRAKQAEGQKAVQDHAVEYDQVQSRQLRVAYEEARGAAEAVATRLGYTHVMAARTRPMNEDDPPVPMRQRIDEMLSRPLLVGPASDDLTDAVLAEMKLERPKPEEAPAEAPAPATPEAPKPGGG